jgi:hypothetical protein
MQKMQWPYFLAMATITMLVGVLIWYSRRPEFNPVPKATAATYDVHVPKDCQLRLILWLRHANISGLDDVPIEKFLPLVDKINGCGGTIELVNNHHLVK